MLSMCCYYWCNLWFTCMNESELIPTSLLPYKHSLEKTTYTFFSYISWQTSPIFEKQGMHTNRNLSFNNLRPLEFKCSYLKCHKKDICDMVKVLYSRLPHKLSSWAFILSTRSWNIFDLHRRMCNTFLFFFGWPWYILYAQNVQKFFCCHTKNLLSQTWN